MINTFKFLLLPFILLAKTFFCRRQASLINLLIRFLSTAFLKCFLLTLKAVCKYPEALREESCGPASVYFAVVCKGLEAGPRDSGWRASRYKTRKGKAENDLPSLNNCSMALVLLSLSLLPKVYRCCCCSNSSKLKSPAEKQD